jgi:hypothetical protein
MATDSGCGCPGRIRRRRGQRGADTTTLHRELPDQGALHGLIQRVADLGLELIGRSVVGS